MATARPSGAAAARVSSSSRSIPPSSLGMSRSSSSSTSTIKPASRAPLAPTNGSSTFQSTTNDGSSRSSIAGKPIKANINNSTFHQRSAAAAAPSSNLAKAVQAHHARSTTAVAPSNSANHGPLSKQATADNAIQTARSEGDSNIKVVVRCRGITTDDNADSPNIPFQVASTKGTEILLNPTSPISSLPPLTDSQAATSIGLGVTQATPAGKLYTFDHVFGEQADQAMLYGDVVAPILDEVLMGYNCTIFAYGQTGTGKTHTMEGDLTPSSLGAFSPQAGIIPRTLHRLFHLLEGGNRRAGGSQPTPTDFSVRVSFLELYNEELRDLNVSERAWAASTGLPSNEDAGALPPTLRIYDDGPSPSGQTSSAGTSTSAGGKRGGGVTVAGLEETHVLSAAQAVEILARGSARRQSASTKCNDKSSRSHAIFTITVHVKEVSNKGEDLLRIGKLNLVDLAGSENVGRSGAVSGRAREAGMINQSLLTLGRVINALVEKSPHVPYRESKLTRLLQDSLGGRTKTCIIATISQSRVNLEETLSTLDYAARAKSIRNRPEANSRLTKAALLSAYAAEIERLKADVVAAREQNGVYLSTESWREISEANDAQKRDLANTKRQADICQSQLRTTTEQFEQALRLLGTREAELKLLTDALSNEKTSVNQLEAALQDVRQQLIDETTLRNSYNVERKRWKAVASEAVHDIEELKQKIARKHALQGDNAKTIEVAREELQEQTTSIMQALNRQYEQNKSYIDEASQAAAILLERQVAALESNNTFVASQLDSLRQASSALTTTCSDYDIKTSAFLQMLDTAVESLASKAAQQAAEISELVQAGHKAATEHSQMASNMIATTAMDTAKFVEALQASASAQIASCVDFAQAERKHEHAALKLENDQLRLRNDALAQIIADQAARAAAWQKSFVAAMTSSLDQFCSSQQDKLRQDAATIAAASKDEHAQRTSRHKRKQDDLTRLEQEALASSNAISAQAAAVTEEVVEKRARYEHDARQYTDALEVRNADLEKRLSGLSGHLSTGLSDVQQHSVSFDAMRADFRTAAVQQIEIISTENSETYRDLQEDMVACANELQEGLNSLKSMADAQHTQLSSHTGGILSIAEKIVDIADTRLQNGLAADTITGKTPMKRRWQEVMQEPSSPASEGDLRDSMAGDATELVTIVDGANPSQYLPSTAPVSSLPASRASVADAIAARRAVRKSSMAPVLGRQR